MQLVTYIIDSFTSVPFKGNPTGVCITTEISESSMLSIANELNFPVTAFIKKINANEYSIRYFTPTTEIPACGHATLASAKAAAMESGVQAATFHTREGVALTTRIDDELVMMTYPKYEMQAFDLSNETLAALQLKEYKTAGYCRELETVFIETDAQTLKTIQPDHARLVQSNDSIIEVVITAASDSKDYDYLLRSFCPWIGIDEDPVTGSVHTVLAGYWKDRLGKPVLKAYQASKRGGEVLIESLDDKVAIGGKCMVILKGQIEL